MNADRHALAEAELPTDLAEAFRRVADLDERPGSLAEAVDAVEALLEGSGVEITLDQLYQPEATRHAVHVGDTVEYVPCVLDALIAAELAESKPVEVQSEPPVGDETVRFHVTGDGVDVEPGGAVVSFGLATEEATASGADELSSTETMSPTSCSYINAFPDSDAYERWADGVSGGMVTEISTEAAVAFADEAANGWVFG